MTRSPLLARKYARALYDATNGKAELAAIAQRLPGIEAELARPKLTVAEVLSLLGGKPASAEITNLIKILLRRKRLRLLPEIVETYTLISEEVQGIKRATVTAATPLDMMMQDKLKTMIKKMHGAREIKLAVQVEPAMIGGITIRVGDNLVDGSVKTVLDEFRSRF